MGAFVLLIMLWSPHADHPGTITSAEFSSEATCEAAAKAADRKFSGWGVSTYTVCSPK